MVAVSLKNIVESDTSQSSTCDFPELPAPEEPQPTPEQPQPTVEQPQPTPEQPQPTVEQPQPAGGKSTDGNKLASTGANTGVAIAIVGLLGIAGVGLVVARRRAR